MHGMITKYRCDFVDEDTTDFSGQQGGSNKPFIGIIIFLLIVILVLELAGEYGFRNFQRGRF